MRRSTASCPRLIFAELQGRTGHFHAAATRMPPRQHSLLHDHDFYEFFLITDGSAKQQLNDQQYEIATGTLGFIRPPDRHCYHTGPLGLELLNIAFPARWWRGFIALRQPIAGDADSYADSDRFAAMSLTAADFASCRDAMERLMGESAHSACALLESCATFDRCWHAAAAQPLDSRQSPPDWMAQLYRDMSDPQLAAHDISWWQQRSGRSPEHLARVCRKYYGMTLTDLLNRFRIRHIQRRLRQEPAKISTLALENGFNNLGYFYRLFRRECGVTPRQWLRTTATVPIR